MSENIQAGEGEAATVVIADAGADVAELRARLVQAELKAAAIRAGMVDLDGVKLVDLSTVQVNEAGEVIEAAKVMAAMRAAKPWLFGGSSSSAATAPRAEAPRVKKATEMTVEEWRAARAELLRRR